jgi:hypothetical protein
MLPAKKTFLGHHKIKAKNIRILWCLTTMLCITACFLMARNTLSANGGKSSAEPDKIVASATPESIPTQKTLPQTQVSRIKVVIGEAQDIIVDAATINSFTVVSPEIATAQIKSAKTLTIDGLKIGETILIVSDSQKRLTYIIEVVGKRAVSERRNIAGKERFGNEIARTSGSYTVSYVQGFNENPSLLKNNIDFQRKLSKNRTLRVSGEISKLIGGNDRNQAFAQAENFGLDRLSVGVDSPGKSVDFLDSQIKVSTLSFNNFPMRGFHLVKTLESLSNSGTQTKGVEIFAGLARPSLAFYDDNQGKIAGAILPIAGGEAWQIRGGFITVSPQQNNRIGRGGTIFEFTGIYAPNKKFLADGEMAYATGGLSWRMRMDVKLRKYGVSGEITRFDKDSPLNSIGAQTGGRKSEALALYWRPDNRFSFSANYNHTDITRIVNSRLDNFNRTTFYANASYRVNRNSRLNLRFLEQKIETAVPGGSSKFQIATRSITFGHNIRLNQNWTNNFEARINFSRESTADATLENGFNLNEQARFSWNKNSITGFFNYTYKTPSLTSLIVRNPQILPALLQEAFLSNPALFLQVYRDRLAFLLGGAELPQTRSLDAGLRFQTVISHFTLTGETRYSAGEVFSQNQKNLLASLGLNVRLDAANSLQINGWKAFGGNGQSAMALSFTHRFGAGNGGGFQFWNLLGFDKGRVQGRVYYDLNGNGQDDKDEPGAAGMTIQLNDKRSVKTDVNGRYQFSANEGEYNIALISNDLGVRLRASTPTQQKISLYSRQTQTVSFGISNFGFISGRLFNDLSLTGEAPKSDIQGVGGVKVILRSGNIVVEQMTNAGGIYEFQNLCPENYTLEIDPATLPANFKVPVQTSWEIKVDALQGFYFDIPVIAQRAVAGVIFIDKDGDGQFNAQKDTPVEGASVTANDSVAVSDVDGAYILRNLAAGKIKLRARSPQGIESPAIFLELGAEPVTKREVNLVIQR